MNRATLSLETLLRAASAELESGGLLELVRLPAREGAGRKLDPPLPGTLRRRLARKGIEELWSHQAEAIEAVRRGENVVVSTGTASGKSLVFNLPVFETMLADGAARALYLYPTKALAQDQLRAIRSFAIPSITAATYDGDTPMEERPSVRKFAGIVLSNPDMLHFGIIPAHRQWAQFFSGLRFVVVDETHILRGVFGSHVGCILRRLRRIARHYGADPQFIMTSATIGNPGDLAGRLAGADFTEITRDGAPKGERLFGFWNPPFIDEARGIRSSTNWESARLVSHLASSGVHTIAFAKSRKSAELIAKHARTLVHTDDVAARIRSYRAGYLAEDRREIEKQLFSGELLAVAATSALELGIDVGGLDAVVMNGFPGTVAQVWQQAGRAGRQAGEAAAVLVGRDDPLDQYYVRHPDVLLSKPYEAALVDTTNPNILRPHLGCAAYELPLDSQVVDELFGEGASAVADAMLEAGDLVLRVGASRRRLHWKRRTPPGRELDIRSAGGPVYSIVEEATGVLMGTVDGSRALQQLHPGAVYLHQGDNFEVGELDLRGHVALVSPLKGNYYTHSRVDSDLRILKTIASRRVGNADFYVGRVEVTEHVVAFERRDISTGSVLAVVDLHLPPNVLETVAFWYTVGREIIRNAAVEAADLPGALHAAEHAAIGMLPLFAMADRWDIGGLSTALAAGTGMPTVFIYDGYPGGAGIAERGFAQAREHLAATLEAVANCPCEAGCPSCVQSPKCGNGNEPLDKAAAVRLLEAILWERLDDHVGVVARERP